jgi:hypothetical protein
MAISIHPPGLDHRVGHVEAVRVRPESSNIPSPAKRICDFVSCICDSGFDHRVGYPHDCCARQKPSAPETWASQDRTFCCVLAHAVLPVVRDCGLGQRQRPCSRPSWSWPCVRTSLSKYGAKLQAEVALYQRALHCSRFRGKRAKIGQTTGPYNPGRLSHWYRCDNATLIRRPSPIRGQERYTDGVSFEGQQSAGCRKTCGRGAK